MPMVVKSDSDNERVFLEVNKEVMDAIEFGQEVKVLLKGEVKSMESREMTDYSKVDESSEPVDELNLPKKVRHEIDVEVSSMKVYPVNEFAELSEDEDEEY